MELVFVVQDKKTQNSTDLDTENQEEVHEK